MNFLRKMIFYCNTHQFISILLINTILFSLLAYLLPIRFETNDDIIMCLISSGAYTGESSAHLVFIHYLYGVFLVFLYKLLPNIEWYTISFCLIHILSITIILWTIIKNSKSIWIKILFCLLFYIIEIRIILLFQFTTTSAICSFAGLLLLFQEKRKYTLLGVLLFLLGVLIRFDAAMLVLLLMFPVFIYRIIKTKKIKLSYLLPLLACVVFAFSLKVLDNSIYKKDLQWSEYKNYNKLRGEINDNPNALKIVDNLPENISFDDYQLLLSFFPDPQIFNIINLEKIYLCFNQVTYKDKLENLHGIGAYRLLLLIIGMMFLFAFIQNFKYDKYIGLFLVLYFIFYMIVLFYILLSGTLKYRVFISSLFPVFYTLFYFINTRQFFSFSFFSFIALLLIFNIIFFIRTNKIRVDKNKGEKGGFTEQMELFNSLDSNEKIIPYADDFSMEFLNPFYISKLLKEKIIVSGWMTNIPYNINQFDSYLNLLDQDKFLLISKNSYKYAAPLLKNSFISNYNKEVVFKELISTDNYLLVDLNIVKDDTIQ